MKQFFTKKTQPKAKQNKPTTHIYHLKENLQNQKYV